MKPGQIKIAAILVMTVLLIASIVFTSRIKGASFELSSKGSNEGVQVDKRLLDMVKHLEDELEERASFGYRGSRDPFTGKRRIVAEAKKIIKTTAAGTRRIQRPKGDDIKLTAVIMETAARPTAVIMINDRSMQVERGDTFKGKENKIYQVLAVRRDQLALKSAGFRILFDIQGRKKVIKE